MKYQPLGPILLISPWNFPFWMPIRSIVPQIVLGNTVLYKPAPITSISAEYLKAAMDESGLEGILENIYFDHTETEYVISHPKVRGVAFTGSTFGGKTIGELSGKHVKKALLELGGSDPFIVLEDADIEKASQAGCLSRIINNGQACINAKRYIVHEDVYDQFKEGIIKNLKLLKIGDPSDESTTLGPLARADLYSQLRKQVLEAVENGATIGYGDLKNLEKEPLPEEGLYFHPMILENVTIENPVYRQELFGPVSTLYKVSSEEEALALGN